MCDVVVDGPPQMGDGQDSAQSIHSQTGYSPGAPKAAQKAQKVRRVSHRFAPVGPKRRKVHVFRSFVDQLMPLSCEIDEKTQLSSEIGFATGHPKAAPEVPKVTKNDCLFIEFCFFNQQLMPVSSEIGKSYQSI